MKPKFITLRELANTTGLSESTLRRRVRDGTLTPTQLGGRNCKLLFHLDATLEQLRGSSPPTQSPDPVPGPKPRWTRDLDL